MSVFDLQPNMGPIDVSEPSSYPGTGYNTPTLGLGHVGSDISSIHPGMISSYFPDLNTHHLDPNNTPQPLAYAGATPQQLAPGMNGHWLRPQTSAPIGPRRGPIADPGPYVHGHILQGPLQLSGYQSNSLAQSHRAGSPYPHNPEQNIPNRPPFPASYYPWPNYAPGSITPHPLPPISSIQTHPVPDCGARELPSDEEGEEPEKKYTKKGKGRREPGKTPVYNKRFETPQSWGEGREFCPLFVYNEDGELLFNRKYTAEEIRHYIENCPRNLVMWVQQSPTQVSNRIEGVRNKCMWTNCPRRRHIIDTGFFRVAFDEFPHQSTKGLRDPIRVAGTMHLHCYEQCFDPVVDYLAGRLKADDRRLKYEIKNPIDITNKSKSIVQDGYVRWFEGKQPLAHARKYEDSLSGALNNHHLAKETGSRQDGRDKPKKRGNGKPFSTIDKHRGDLALYCIPGDNISKGKGKEVTNISKVDGNEFQYRTVPEAAMQELGVPRKSVESPGSSWEYDAKIYPVVENQAETQEADAQDDLFGNWADTQEPGGENKAVSVDPKGSTKVSQTIGANEANPGSLPVTPDAWKPDVEIDPVPDDPREPTEILQTTGVNEVNPGSLPGTPDACRKRSRSEETDNRENETAKRLKRDDGTHEKAEEDSIQVPPLDALPSSEPTPSGIDTELPTEQQLPPLPTTLGELFSSPDLKSSLEFDPDWDSLEFTEPNKERIPNEPKLSLEFEQDWDSLEFTEHNKEGIPEEAQRTQAGPTDVLQG